MRKISSIILGLFLFVFLGSGVCLGQLLSLKDIFRNPDKYNDSEVIIEGEVIGEPLRAQPQGKWINIVSEANNIGVYVEDEILIRQVKHWGGYKQRGDYLQVRGIFNKDCPVHQEQDIHARSIKVIKEGAPRHKTVSELKKRFAMGFGIICLTMALIYSIKVQYLRRRRKRAKQSTQ